jgi:hypothetical protein
MAKRFAETKSVIGAAELLVEAHPDGLMIGEIIDKLLAGGIKGEKADLIKTLPVEMANANQTFEGPRGGQWYLVDGVAESYGRGGIGEPQ